METKISTILRGFPEIIKEEGLQILIIRGLEYIFKKFQIYHLLSTAIVERFRFLNEKHVHSYLDAVNFAFRFTFFGARIKPIQIKQEICELYHHIRSNDLKIVLEIGTSNGGTLFFWCRFARDDATIISIDLPEGKFGGGYPKWRIPLYRSFAKKNQKVYLIRTDSHNPAALEEVRRILNGRYVNFLFIDGDHTYEGIRKDFKMYSTLLKNGGVIAIHDIVKHPPERGCEVSRLWEEIKNGYRHLEIIKDHHQKWAGIGVLNL